MQKQTFYYEQISPRSEEAATREAIVSFSLLSFSFTTTNQQCQQTSCSRQPCFYWTAFERPEASAAEAHSLTRSDLLTGAKSRALVTSRHGWLICSCAARGSHARNYRLNIPPFLCWRSRRFYFQTQGRCSTTFVERFSLISAWHFSLSHFPTTQSSVSEL